MQHSPSWDSSEEAIAENLSSWSSNDQKVELRLFTNIENPLEVKDAVRHANSDGSWVCAADASKIVSIAQLGLAAWKATSNKANGSLKTGHWDTDIYYYMSQHSKISECCSMFELKEHVVDVAIVSVGGQSPALSALYDSVRGERVGSPYRWLRERAMGPDPVAAERQQSLMKFYKITPQELLISSLSEAVVNRIAVKEFIK